MSLINYFLKFKHLSFIRMCMNEHQEFSLEALILCTFYIYVKILQYTSFLVWDKCKK